MAEYIPMELLPDEKEAKAFVARIGEERAERLLSSICNRVNRRINKANEGLIGQFFDNSCIRKASWEVELPHKLKLGLMLNNTDSPSAARQRILVRVAERRRRAAERRATKQLDEIRK